MLQLVVTNELDEELEELAKTDEDFVADVDLLLESLEQDIDSLTPPPYRNHHHFDYVPPFDIGEVVKAKRAGYFICRVKIWSADNSLYPFRLMLGYDSKNDVFYALAVRARGNAYDARNSSWSQLLDRYRRYIQP